MALGAELQLRCVLVFLHDGEAVKPACLFNAPTQNIAAWCIL